MLPKSSFFTLEQLSEGVYAAIVKEGMGAWGNAGIVDLGDSTLIIDTFITPAAARDLRSSAESMIKSPIKYVLNTHWHGDHTMGNQIFKDATIFSTDVTYEIMKENYQEKSAIAEEWSENLQNLIKEKDAAPTLQIQEALAIEIKEVEAHIEGLKETDLTLPNKVFTEKMYRLKGSNREVEFHHLGGGHSYSDTFVYLPNEKIAFTGDLVFVDTHPSIHSQPVREWLDILEQLKTFDIAALAAGHGPVGTKQHIKNTTEYLTAILNQPPSDIPDQYLSWKFPHVYRWNLESLKNQMKEVNK